MIVMMWTFLAILAAGIALVIVAFAASRGSLDGDTNVGPRRFLWFAVIVLVVGLLGIVAAGGIAMGRGDFGSMMRNMSGMGGMMGGTSGRRGAAPAVRAPERTVTARDNFFEPRTMAIPEG